MNLGKAILLMSQVRGMKQNDLAEKAGLKKNTISLIVNNKRNVSVDSLVAIAKALEVRTSGVVLLAEYCANEQYTDAALMNRATIIIDPSVRQKGL